MDASVWRGRAAVTITLLSIGYAVGLLAWVVFEPAFNGQTLLEYGGVASLVITAQPLVFALVMWAILHHRCTVGSQAATAAAWTLGLLFLAYSVVGALTIAAGAFPAAALLLVAVMITPRAPQPTT